jgi:tetratricopeptide (TPR) repeat protein
MFAGAMKNAISIILSATLISGAMPAVVFAQDSADAQAVEPEQMTPEERARRVEALAASGAKSYRAGDYEAAIEAFKKGYAIEPVPNLLYNIAKSYEKQAKYADAVDYYQKFVVAPEVDSNARQAALERIESLREVAELKRRQQAQEGAGQGNAVATGPAQAEEPTNTAALWTFGGGVALLGAGLAMGYLASSEADNVKEGETFSQRQEAQENGQTYALVADGLFVAAAAVAGIGVYLYLTDTESETNQASQPGASSEVMSRAVVAPWVSTESAGLGMSLDF